MRTGIIAILVIVSVFSAFEIYKFYAEQGSMSERLSKLNAEIAVKEAENKSLKDEIKYLADPDNLEKELRSRFNYKKSGEKMIIVVPGN